MTAGLWALAIVACGAGAVVRFLIAHLGHTSAFPWTTMASNAIGTAVLGAAAAAVAAGAPPSVGLVVGSGFAGGLTTFSTLAVDAVILRNEQRTREFWAYLGGTVAVGLTAGLVGYAGWTTLAG